MTAYRHFPTCLNYLNWTDNSIKKLAIEINACLEYIHVSNSLWLSVTWLKILASWRCYTEYIWWQFIREGRRFFRGLTRDWGREWAMIIASHYSIHCVWIPELFSWQYVFLRVQMQIICMQIQVKSHVLIRTKKACPRLSGRKYKSSLKSLTTPIKRSTFYTGRHQPCD